MQKDEIKESLRQAGLKASKPRLELLRCIRAQDCAISAEDLYKLVKRKGFDFSTVYRSLNAFVENGLAQAVHIGDGMARFEAIRKSANHHHHLVCRRCRKVEIIENCLLSKKISNKTFKGFQNLTHRLEFEGICPSCL